MKRFRRDVGPWGTVVSCRGCGRIVIDDDRPSDRDIEEAEREHVCTSPRAEYEARP